MKAIQRDILSFNAVGLLLIEHGVNVKNLIDSYDKNKLGDLFVAEIQNEEKCVEYLIESAQQLYKKIEKKFPANKQE